MFELNGMGHWVWFSLGVVLIALEALVPGFVLIWFGVSALLTGSAVVLFDLGGLGQACLFAVLSLVTVVAGRVWLRRRAAARPPGADPAEKLNQDGVRWVGHELTLVVAISSGVGRVKTADSSTRCTGPDLPAGSRVRVISSQGGTLAVVPAEGGALVGAVDLKDGSA